MLNYFSANRILKLYKVLDSDLHLLNQGILKHTSIMLENSFKKLSKLIRRFSWSRKNIIHPHFVIFGAMRSGSNLLQEKLNYFEDIVCLGEVYNPAFVGVDRPHINKFSYSGYGRNNKKSLVERDENPHSVLDSISRKALENRKKLGFRMFDGHCKSIESTLVENPDVKKIILYRDLIDSFVSLEIARQSGQWVKKSNSGQTKVKSIEFSVKDFEIYVEESQKYFQSIVTRLETSGQSYLVISYDDVLDNDRVRSVAKYIGSPSEMSVKNTKLTRQNPSSLENKINNYDDVKAYIESFNKTVFG